MTGVDASQLAVDQATANARLNGLDGTVKFICEDVFELLPELEERGEKFDVVILDPPAFTKSRNSVKNAVKGYREINLRAMKLVKDGGYGHTASIYLHPSQTEKLNKFADRMKTCRILVNTPSAQGGIGDLYNFKLAPSLTLGCGSYGGNSVSENVGVKHLLNVKTVAERRENMLWFRTPEKIYFKKGCLPVALDELKTVYEKKKSLHCNGYFLIQQWLYKADY